MSRTIRPMPVADACRLILAKDHLGDIDLALRLLGLERSSVVGSEEVGGAEIPVTEDLLELFEGSDAELDSDSDAIADQQEDDRVKEILQGSASRAGEKGANLVSRGIGGRPYSTAERSMIAYMLTPDDRNPDELTAQPTYNYNSIPNRVQRLQGRAITPEPD